MRRYLALTVFTFSFLVLVFVVVQGLHIPLLADPSPWMRRGGVFAALLGAGLLVADVLLPVPSSLVMMANGGLFGVLGGAAVSLLGSVGGTMLGFAIGRRGGRLVARLTPAEERARARHLIERWGPLAIVITRPLPLLADTAAIVAGASPLGWRRVALAATVGSLPPALLYALAGATAASLQNVALTFGLVLLVAGAFSLFGRRAERFLARRGNRDGQAQG